MRNATRFMLGAAACAALSASAHGDFAAYNDFVTSFSSDANVTHHSTATGGDTPVVSAAFALKNYATGADLPVTMEITNRNGNPTGTGPGAEMSAGTDGANMFGGKALTAGQVIWYGVAGAWHVDLLFQNLTPSAKYTFAGTLDRGNATYANNRWTAISITGVDDSVYAASAGAYKVDDSMVSIDSYNTINGYVAKWTDIAPGADGAFTVRFTYATDAQLPAAYTGTNQDGYGYGPAAIMLQETAVPEPATLSLIGLAGLLLGRRRNA